jgi:cyclic beta-1,2-glucan synthetase
VTIGNIISSMRLISKIDWHDFYEEVTLVDPILAQDPVGAYSRMDWGTRDSYRKVIERISKRTLIPEIEVSQKVIEHAKKMKSTAPEDLRKKHVGYYLLEKGVRDVEKELGYTSPIKERLVRFVDEDPTFIYFGSISVLVVFFLSLLLSAFPYFDQDPTHLAGIILLTIIPISDLSISVLNYLITILRLPKRLPRMETKQGIPENATTMVVVPCLLNNIHVIQELIDNLEVQYLANQDPHIYFAILGDLTDATSETTDADKDLLTYAHAGINNLNRRYNQKERPRFFIFHRSRLYNPSEEKWICWERKRGKILEFNKLLRGDKTTTYIDQELDHDFLKQVEYVITLDADTQLPLQTARRLIGTITHPLNLPVYDPKQGRIVEGYGILQPRISVSIVSAAKTRFSRVFSGNTGIDPYTTAVSDVYQDLFNEGSFTGKGLYVVDAFEKVIGDRVPENCVLSHDLLEGSYARVGLTTDQELIDDFPSNFKTFSKRAHRWTRGDWQIGLWLLPFVPNAERKWVKNNLPYIARWKILDNLRRSVLTPMTLLWLILSWTILPGNPFTWTLAVILTMSFPVYAPSLTDLFRGHEDPFVEHLKRCLWEFKKRIEQIFLMVIFMPTMAVDQIDAIIRALYRMTISKKHLLEWMTFSQTQSQVQLTFGWKEILSSGTFFAAFTFLLLLVVKPISLIVAVPFIITWALTPFASRWTQRRSTSKVLPLDQKEISKFRRYARMTWHFFETFAGEENNWLAPDNFQEDPKPVVATRTSPTNIGLQFLSVLSAYDLGHLGFRSMVESFEKTLGTLGKLERMHGHFFNWYDTKDLTPLNPKYISSVDSGNLAGHLVVLKQAAIKLSHGPFFNPHSHVGLRDTLEILAELIRTLQKNSELPQNGSYKSVLHVLTEMTPFIETNDWHSVLKKCEEAMSLFRSLNDDQEVLQWMSCTIRQVESYLLDKETPPGDLHERLLKIANTCQEIYLAMNFKFLFDDERKIFSIGYNATESRRDDSFYDLLASESRLMSFFAIAKGDVPDEHWFRLGRSMTTVVGSRALISWSATMFEYLMPLLVMRRYGETLLDQTYDSVVLRQIEYGGQRQIPWGISEAGFNARDLNFNYQYGPFGIPGLGLKRGLRDDLVVSPYSTMLAAMVFPHEALENLGNIEKLEGLGHYGFYESMDYTPERVPKGKKSVILKSYMAHHQGMSLISINNLINKSIMQRRFHAEPRVKAVQLLLQERIPTTTAIAKPRAEETHVESFAKISADHHTRSYSDPSLSTPRTQILSNGNYSLMVTSAGAGYSSCEGRMVTRWKEDPTQDNWGQFIYIQNMGTQKTWSAGYQPIESKPKFYESHFSEDKIELTRIDSGIRSHTDIIVSSEDNVEMRRLMLTNNTDASVELEITSYMEVVLAKAQDDAAHPAFSNLFIQTEFLPETSSLLANRRLRTKSELELWGLHVLTVDGETMGPVQYETDRSRFIGRGRSVRNPIVMTNEIDLSNTVGAVLDPIFSLRQRIRIKPGKCATLTYTTGIVYSKVEALRVTEKYRDRNIFLRQMNLGWVKGQIGLRHLNITMEKAHIYQRLGGRILYLAPYLRAQSQVLMANKKNQSALWAYGISGDIPILLTRIQDEKDMDMIRELLRAHEYLKLKGLKIDLVILNEHATSYMQNLQEELMRQILISGFHSLLDKPGGIFIRRADLIPADDLVLIKSVAKVSLFANKGTLEEQLKRRPLEPEMPQKFVPTTPKKDYPRIPLNQPELTFFNGLGGFTPDGKEYVTILKADQWTPAPWINVIANKKDFGFIVSEAGAGYTWSVNSRENRISSWSNDPVSDPVSEAIYIRDEESGAFWSPTPLPIRGPEGYEVRHGQGYSQFKHISNGITHEQTMFVPLNDSVKIIRLKLKNISGKPRKLSTTSYIDFVMGFSRTQAAQTLTTNWDEDAQAILARNSYNNEFAHRISFMTTNLPEKTYTGSRREFIGRNHSMVNPAAMGRKNLNGKTGGGIDPCGVIQNHFDLGINEEKEIIVLIGQGDQLEETRHLAKLYKDSTTVQVALQAVHDYWEHTLTAVTIKTPDESMNLLVNRWLLYQTLACRIWARSAFYQSGGAFGYRDQLQDVMAMVYSHPEITRAQIKLAASRQFPEGDVQHWWHPPTGRGVRTRFSDDLLWLPFVTNFYIELTGDYSILNEKVSFIQTDVLAEGHDETYNQPQTTTEEATIFDHCFRTLDRSLKVGSHGLPLMGSGDWNDGMSRVGNQGKGESVWLAWFLMKTLRGFIPLCVRMNDHERAEIYLKHIEKLKRSIETNAWDGEWYLRAYFDNGDKLGSHENEECRIDAIAQSWSLISGEGDPARSKMALKSVDRYLINREDQIIKLFTPPFDKSAADPGYIKGYLPGVRENGGQYTHAAIWTMMAYAELKDGQTATELFSLINPINRSSTRTGAQKYKVEPYVISADIYGVSPHVGRGGWSWYTGSASWMYRSAIESILGLKVQGDQMTITPCIPKEWDRFQMSYRRGKTEFKITVLNNQLEASMEMDGEILPGNKIPMKEEKAEYQILVKIRS